MKYVKAFESFMNEADEGTTVTETVEIKKEINRYYIDYDMKPVIAAIKGFRKPNVQNITIEIPNVGTITADATGISVDPLSSSLKAGYKRAESLAPGSGWQYSTFKPKVWYNLMLTEYHLNRKISQVMRLEFMDKIKWPIEVNAAGEEAIQRVKDRKGGPSGGEDWWRENSEFDPRKEEADFFIYIGDTYPSVPTYPGSQSNSDGTVATIKEILDGSPNTLTVKITGVK